MLPAKPENVLQSLVFDNRFTRELPADPDSRNISRQVRGACYSRVAPTEVSDPQLVAFSREVAELLELPPAACETDEFAQVFAGNRLLPGMDPFAMCYGGHQFGSWAGQLGDGRAINLGEVRNRRGEHWTLQLKGAGQTPYSRSGDGLAVLRSSIREFLCSEAMHHLGVPTTRALSLVTTGEMVVRDMFYDGHPRLEPGAIVCRVAQSFVRFGNFQIFASRGELETLRKLADFTIRYDFPQLGYSQLPAGEALPREAYVAWFHEVCRTTADLFVHWMRVGFVHGVLNTDNLSILGLTIDYGPYGWLEDYDPQWTPNTTDATGRRYRFEQQPRVGLWNLAQLGNAIAPLVEEIEPLQQGLEIYQQRYEAGWQAMLANKLGLRSFADGDEGLSNELAEILAQVETDMTIFFRRLADVDVHGAADPAEPSFQLPLQDAYYVPEQRSPAYQTRLANWLGNYRARVQADGSSCEERRSRMNATNPKFVLRNYLAQLAIDKSEAGDHSLVKQLLDVLRHPYDEQPEHEQFAEKRPDWARQRAGCSMLSCSS